VSDLWIALARAVHLGTSFSLFGCLLFRVSVARPSLPRFRAAASARVEARLDRLAVLSLRAALAAAVAWLVAESAGMSGASFGQIVPALGAIVLGTQFGTDFLVHLALLVAAGACLLLERRRGVAARYPLGALAAGFAGAAILALAAIGHAAAMTGWERPLMMLVQGVHLLAAGAWLGSLLPLFLLLGQCAGTPPAATAARRFSVLGIVCVSALAVSAAANGWVLVGDIPGLFGTAYGRWALVKTALFAAMLGLAALNRFRFTPALAGADAATATRHLRRSVAGEVALGIALIVAAGLLATSVPAAHAQPSWPFSFRFSAAAMAIPELRSEIVTDLAYAAGGVAVAALGLWRRGLRLVIPVGLAFAAWCLAAPFNLLSVEAFPTTFYQSPTGGTAASVAAGGRLFAEHCATCHGPHGRGEPFMKPGVPGSIADLTAAHVYDHLDGELFWWIGNGIAGTPMPSFAETFVESERWKLIDFIHANADAARFLLWVPGPFPRPPPAPDFSAECTSAGEIQLSDLRGRIVLLIFSASGAATRLDHVVEATRDQTDVTTIIVPLSGESVPSEAFCSSADPDLASAYAYYRAREPAKLAGTGFLIDVNGTLRDVVPYLVALPPVGLRAELEKIRRTPSVVAAQPHLHLH
jgi:putative copper export protein/mono/diheme cytochrome c family protein